MSPLRQLLDRWCRLSPREQALATAVAGLLALGATALSVRGAIATIDRLDREIVRLQTDIVNYSYQIARRQSVEARYGQIASQHSSAWSESEIHDRLRQEVYRLANLSPPGLDGDGIPLSTGSGEKLLVGIPELRGGRLEEGGDGFRAYRIEFAVLPAPFLDMVAYLERLQDSPQSLRIDRIDLRRDPARPEVRADLVLTRIVVDDPPDGAGVTAMERDAAGTDSVALLPEAWACDGGDIAVVTADGSEVLEVRAGDGAGRVYLEREVLAGSVYDVRFDLSSSSTGTIGVRARGESLPGSGDVAVKAGAGFYRYQFRFAAPAGEAGNVPVAFPEVAWDEPGALLRIRDLRVVQVAGVPHGA